MTQMHVTIAHASLEAANALAAGGNYGTAVNASIASLRRLSGGPVLHDSPLPLVVQVDDVVYDGNGCIVRLVTNSQRPRADEELNLLSGALGLDSIEQLVQTALHTALH